VFETWKSCQELVLRLAALTQYDVVAKLRFDDVTHLPHLQQEPVAQNAAVS
jgi:hypothetical protein